MSKEYTLIGGNGTVVSPLEVTEDGDYVAGDSRAFNPVKVRTGGGGSSTLSGLTDVDLTNPTDGQTLVYNATSGKWENGSGESVYETLYTFTELNGTFVDQGHSEYDCDIHMGYAPDPDGPFFTMCLTHLTINDIDYSGPFYPELNNAIVLDENYTLRVNGVLDPTDGSIVSTFQIDAILSAPAPETITVSGYFYGLTEKMRAIQMA